MDSQHGYFSVYTKAYFLHGAKAEVDPFNMICWGNLCFLPHYSEGSTRLNVLVLRTHFYWGLKIPIELKRLLLPGKCGQGGVSILAEAIDLDHQ